MREFSLKLSYARKINERPAKEATTLNSEHEK
jgi:hypothetical protein